MYKLYNASNIPLGLPGGFVTLPPDEAVEVLDQKLLEHPVVINWLRSGRLALIGSGEKVPAETIGSQAPPERPRVTPDDEILKILDGNMKEIAEALPALTDDQFDAIVRAEKNGKTRKGLSGPGGIFDNEWKRRYGIDD